MLKKVRSSEDKKIGFLRKNFLTYLPTNLFTSKKKSAFTLAEVLITLGIIGVVAALTMPSLIANYNKQKTVALLKKFQTTFSQALQKAAYDEGCEGDMKCYFEAIECTNNSDTQDRVSKGVSSIKKQITNIKECTNPTGNGFMLGQCSDYTYNHNYDGSGSEGNYYYNIVTKDGMYIGYTVSGSIATGGWVTVDLNGAAKPNREGRDIFTFWIFEDDKILPPVDRDNCTDSNKYGQSCAARIIKNGWIIDY